MIGAYNPLQVYPGLPAKTRLHIAGRWRVIPFPAVSRYVLPDGLAVDIGCGYGLWAFYLASLYPHLEILGTDPDEEKIRLASQAAEAAQQVRVRFQAGAAQDLDLPECRTVSIVDVLYLIPYELQAVLLGRAAARLECGGRLLVKEIGREPRWKYAWNWLEEVLAVRILRITYGREFYFRSEAGWLDLLRSLGLRVEMVRLDRGFLHPHVLFVGEKL